MNNTISATNGLSFFYLSLVLSVVNVFIYFKCSTMTSSTFWSFVIVIYIIFSYFALAFLVLKRTTFKEEYIEMSYVARFSSKKRLFVYNQIKQVKIHRPGLSEMPSISIVLKERKSLKNICCFSFDKIRQLKTFLQSKNVDFIER